MYGIGVAIGKIHITAAGMQIMMADVQPGRVEALIQKKGLRGLLDSMSLETTNIVAERMFGGKGSISTNGSY
jgi:hypothetical protein